MGDLREPNGAVLEELSVPSSSQSSLGPEVWARAEQAAHEIIRQVQPTVVSEKRRRDVVDYVQRLLKGYLGCEVFPFGSVPLKTYLPDGDIDLTAFCGFNFEEAFATNVYSVLEAEDHNPAAKFVVKDVQYIRAEVKLVKCLVQNIVVDISFNQIGGLCALCFLEEVDRLIGKDHLFKRSIILIKAWCYYESRILGAHHGLISTYALETLVLYIFHLFHSSLSGPLAVLYKFLDYFSKFDWENFCVSLSGPVHLSSLPGIVAERPENGGGDLLLSDDFMRECVRKFSVPSRGVETNYRTFMLKHLNIVDPLKENNNLGRSVSKGNFFRIRSAFSYGARKLGQILLQPQKNIAEEVCKFFTNTLDRHGKGQRPDVQDFLLTFGNGFAPQMVISAVEPSLDDSYAHEEESFDSNSASSEYRVGSEDTRHGVVSNFTEPGTHSEGAETEHQRGVKKSIPSRVLLVAELSEDEPSASTSSHSGDANDLATSGVRGLRISIDCDKLSPTKEEVRISPLGNIPHAPHLYFSRPLENGNMENGDLDDKRSTDSSSIGSKMFAGQEGSSHSIYRDSCQSGASRSHEAVNVLPDLLGDFDHHLENLRYGRLWYDHGLKMPIQPIHLGPPPVFQGNNPWDAIRQSVQFRRDVLPQMNVNGVVPRTTFFPMNPPIVHGGAVFNADEMPKPRGTGTYFPITNHHSYRDRSYLAKGRSHGQLKSPRSNGRGPTPPDRSPQAQSPGRQGVGKPKCLDSHESSPRGKVHKEANGFVHIPEKAPLEAALPEGESCRLLDSAPSPGSQNGEPVFVVNDERLDVQSYLLKDDDDFPPLSV